MYKSIKIHDNDNIMQITNFSNKSTQKENKLNKKFKIITKNLKNVTLNILKNRAKKEKIVNLNNEYITEMNLIKFRPKRLLKLKEQGNSQIALTEMGGNSFEIKKINKSVDKKFLFSNRTGINLFQDLINDKNMMNNFADSEFKSYYILKFAKLSEDFNKLKNYNEIMNENINKRIFIEYFEKLSKLMEEQNKLYFNNIEYASNNININPNENNSPSSNISSYNSKMPNINFNETTKNRTRNNSVQEFPNLFSNTLNTLNNLNLTKYNSSLNNTYLTTLTSLNSSNASNYNKNIKLLFSNWSEIMTNFTKFILHILKEISVYKKDNFNLQKKNIIDETQLNKVSKELEELKKYINQFDISNKIYSQMHKENKINDLKKGFQIKENEYKLMIYKLQEDIKTLTSLLDQNKIYYDKYFDLSKEIGKSKKENELLKVKFNKELQENNLKFLVEKDLKEEINLKLEKLNNEINEIHEEKNEEKRINVEMQSLIKKLRIEINEKEENIMMMREELEIYLRKYNEEKSKYASVLKDLKLLEEKIKKDNELKLQKEKEEKEKKEKEEKEKEDNKNKNKKNNKTNNKN